MPLGPEGRGRWRGVGALGAPMSVKRCLHRHRRGHALPQRGHRSHGHRGALGRLEAEASSLRPSAPPAGRASRRGRDIRGPPSRSTLRRPNSCSSMSRPQRARPLIDGARTSARRTACTQTQDPADSAAPRTPTRRARRTGGRAATRRARVPVVAGAAAADSAATTDRPSAAPSLGGTALPISTKARDHAGSKFHSGGKVCSAAHLNARVLG